MSVLVGLVLIILLFFAPAIACYPRLLRTPWHAASIPIVSCFITFVTFFILKSFYVFTHTLVLGLAIAWLGLAVIRVYLQGSQRVSQWQRQHIMLSLINLSLILPLVAIAASSAFSTNDEIYSWGMWGLQYYLGKPIDYHIAGGIYPQLLSMLIAYCFKLLGTTLLQASVKVSFVLFPLIILQVLAFASKKTLQCLPIYLLVAFASVFPGDYYLFYARAYADPLMMAALALSVFYFLRYQEKGLGIDLGLLSVTATVAVLSKQPALLWALLVLPVLMTKHCIRQKCLSWQLFVAVGLPFIIALSWVMGPGMGFLNNPYVVHQSMAGRDVMQQLGFALTRYFIEMPYLLLLVIAALLIGLKKPYLRGLTLLFIIPGLILWLLFGAYQIRLGVYVTILCGLILAREHFLSLYYWEKITVIREFCSQQVKPIVYLALTLSLLIAILLYGYRVYFGDYPRFPLNGVKTTINSMFTQGNKVYKQLINHHNLSIWISNPFAFGAFYGRTPIIHPPLHCSYQYDWQRMWQDIRSSQPDFVITNGTVPSNYPRMLATIIKHYPQYFTLFASGRGAYNFAIYRFNGRIHAAKTMASKHYVDFLSCDLVTRT